ncbi:MAG TPA: 7-cyano-7-deazaguanine synthase QueC [Candidatus Kapabacteria bacterium]|nr:7-cyano-7-deazaguanine synthase QueC [Candidatus Kapabacteria bacterium]
MTSVVLLSGGMDSTLTLAIARRESDRVAALHLNYRHRTEQRELKAYNDICGHYGIQDRLVIDLEFLRKIGGSSLTDDSIAVGKADLQSHDIPQTYVPFRNGNFLAMAASWAEVIKAERIYIGAVEEDGSGYPDCRRVFFDAFEQTIDLGTRPETRIKIMTPLISMKKSGIVRNAVELEAPLALTWSCYQSETEACGECDSCALRLRGFEEAGVTDPIPYRTRPHYA